MTGTDRLHLLKRVSDLVTRRQPGATILDYLAAAFPEAFPHFCVQVWVVQEPGNEITTSMVLGELEPDDRWEQIKEKSLRLFASPNDFSASSKVWEAIEGSESLADQWRLFPLPIGEEVAGVLCVRFSAGGGFPAADETIFGLLANELGQAIGQEQLLAEVQVQTNNLAVLGRITETAGTLKLLKPTLGAIHQQLIDSFNTDLCYVGLYDELTEMVSFPFMTFNGRSVEVDPLPVSHPDSIVSWAIRNNRPLIVNDWPAEEHVVKGIHKLGDPRSLLCYPMRVGQEVVGVLSIQSDEPNAYDDHDRQLLAVVAGHVAVIVKNARLYTKTTSLAERSLDQFRTAEILRKAAAVVGSSLSQAEVLDKLLLTLSEVIPYDSASIFSLREGRFVFAAQRGFTDASTVAEEANRVLNQSQLLEELVENQQVIVLNDVSQDPRWLVVKGAEHVGSWIGAPLLVGQEVLGVLMVDSVKHGGYGERESWLVSTLASHAAVAVQNARLHQEVQRQLGELTTVYEATAAMTADLDQASVNEKVVRVMAETFDVELCIMYAWDIHNQHFQHITHENRGEATDKPISTKPLPSTPLLRKLMAAKEPRTFQLHRQEEPAGLALLRELEVQAALLMPLHWRNEVYGLLIAGQVSRPRQFNRQEVQRARSLAGQAAVALEHGYLFAKAQRRVEELSAFHEIALNLNTPLELGAVLDVITKSSLELIAASNVHIFLYDPERKEFTTGSALSRDGSREPAVAKPRSDGITSAVVEAAEPVIVQDAANSQFYQSPESSAWGIGAIAGFPLRRGERVFGAFTLTYMEPHTFTDDELLLLNLLADQAAVAVENARLFADAQRRLLDMSALVDMAQQVTGDLNVELVMGTTVQVLRELLSARASSIALLDSGGQELIIEAGAGINPKWVHTARMQVGEGVSGRAVSEQRLIYIQDTKTEADFLFFDDVLRSLIAVPLVSRDEVIGALTVDSDRPNAFSESDIQLMTIAAAQVSSAIANARLFEEAEDRAAKLAVAYEELKENDRLKDELVQNVSHELRTPLTFVKGYVDLLMDGEMGLINMDQQETLEIVADKTVEITRIIDDIMSLQRIDVANLILEKFAMAELVDETVAGHRLSANQQGLKVEYPFPSSRGEVVADRGRVAQVINNIIVNAMKFSPNGGVITVEMVDDPSDVTIVISDQGIGMPSDKVDKIFERFYQVDGTSRRRFGGAGIGLAIVKRIIDAHGGRIWVKSEVNKGSAFYCQFPKQPVLEISERLLEAEKPGS